MSRINKDYLNGDYVIDKMYHQNKNSERLIKNKPTLQSFELQTSASVNEDDGGEYNIYFGSCTAFANESRLVIGAYAKNIYGGTNDAGMVFIFDSSSAQGWTQTTGVYAPNPAGNQHFGEVVAAEGNYLVASAPSRTVSGTLNVGEVFIYRYVENTSKWVMEQAILPAGQASGQNRVGKSLAMNFPYVAIGAPSRYSNSGSVWIYKSSSTGWKVQQTLTASNGRANGDTFGNSLSFSGSYLAVGQIAYNGSRGATYIDKTSSDGWPEKHFLPSSNPATNAQFGRSISLMSGSRLVIGEDWGISNASGHKDGAFEVYGFTDSANTFLQRVGNPDCTGSVSSYNYSSRFGRFIATNEEGWIVCARPKKRGVNEGYSEGNRALLVYEPNNNEGTSWALSKTLTRSTEGLDYYGSSFDEDNPGRWHYSFYSGFYQDMVDMIGYKIVLGTPDEPSSQLGNTVGDPYGYSYGAMRVWESFYEQTTTSGSFRFLANGSFALRSQNITAYNFTSQGGKKNL